MTKDRFVDIDMERLDEEWVAQPGLFHKYARRLADAKDGLARAKANLDVVEADVELKIRDNPANYGLTKVTEAAVKIRVLLHKRREVAVKEVNEAKHKVDILQAAVDALDHKKRALESLVSLHGQSYFSTPRVRQGADPKVREKLREAEQKEVFGRGKRK